MRRQLNYVAGFAGLLLAGWGMQASAQGLNQMVGALNAVLNPNQAQQLEDQARRNGRPAEEGYWERYRAGLEEQGRHGDYNGPGYGADQRQGYGPGYDQRGQYQQYGSAPPYNQPRDYRGYGSSPGYGQNPGYQGYGGGQGYPPNAPYNPGQPGYGPGYGR